MNSGFSNFKTLGSDCEVYVRRLTHEHSDNRLISNIRKVSKTSGGFVVELDSDFQLHTLVEMDVKFPGQSHYYRSRGLVEWHAKGANPSKPHKLGIRVITMEKLDPEGVPMVKPKPRKPAMTARVSKHVGLPDFEAAPDASRFPETAAAPPRVEEKKVVRRFTELKIPKAEEISELLTSLIGDKVTVSKVSSAMSADDIAVVGSYRGEDSRTLSLIGADIALTNQLGAALAMIPKDVARSDIEAGRISEETLQNTQEIFNINTSVLNGPEIPHHRFTKLYDCTQDEPPAEMRSLMADPVDRADYNVEVPGYGTGRLCFLFAEWHKGQRRTDDPEPSHTSMKSDGAPAAEFKSASPADDRIDLAKTQFATPETLGNEKAAPSFKVIPPKAQEVNDLFTNLVGDTVTAEPVKGSPLHRDAFAVIGNFVTDDNRTVAVCAMDIHLSNWAAAALAMIPKDVVKMDISNNRLSDECRDNVQEILNIASSIFNKTGMPHLRFGRLLVSAESDPPPEINAVIETPGERVDFTVKIPGYGQGVMACLLKAF